MVLFDYFLSSVLFFFFSKWKVSIGNLLKGYKNECNYYDDAILKMIFKKFKNDL